MDTNGRDDIEPVDVQPCIDRWKRQLLDFSGRNRLLFFRPTRQTLTLHRGETEVWDELVEGNGLLLDEPVLLGNEYRDDTAKTRGEADAARRLKALTEMARTFNDEQGVHVLHACFGWLTWVDESRVAGPNEQSVELPNGRRGRVVRSPLLFVPVSFERIGQRIRLVREPNAPIEPNITAIHYMRLTFGLEVPVNEDDELTPESMLSAWSSLTEERRHWSVGPEERTVVDAFSFKKIALLRELDRSIDRVAEQPVLRALCGNSDLLLSSSSAPEYGSLDDDVPPKRVQLVVPADSSQMRAVLAVLDGGSIVVQGPPGTGKSQTITNLIASLVAQEKRVLFVAEKRAARDVVVANLERAGVGEVILHITDEVFGRRSGGAVKRDITEQLASILEQGPGEYSTYPFILERVGRSRAELNAYVRHLHEPLGPEPWTTPYLLLARWAVTPEDLVPDSLPPLPSVRNVTQDWVENALEYASAVDDLGEQTLSQASRSWLGAGRYDWTDEVVRDIQKAVTCLAETPSRIHEIVARHHAVSRLPKTAVQRADVIKVAELLDAGGQYGALRNRWYRWLVPHYWKVRSRWQAFEHAGGRGLGGDEAASADALRKLLSEWQSSLELLSDWHSTADDVASIDGIAEVAAGLQCNFEALRSAMQVRERAAHAAGAGLEDAVIALVRDRTPGVAVRDRLEASLRYRWALEAADSHPSLAIEASARERRRRSFHKDDDILRRHAVAATLNAVARWWPSTQSVAPPKSELGIVRQQINAKRRKPLRWLFSHAPDLILMMKPCIVASPLAVAQFLHHPAFTFDAVIFDEASQIPTADAVVPMSKGNQTVVVGDSQQMPPTRFFDRSLEDGTGDWDIDDVPSFESILQQSALLPKRPLLWHYRSQDERLIAFSNHLFYNGSLHTFPASWAEHPDRGLRFDYLPNATYGRGGSRANPEEAERVVDLLLEERRKDRTAQVGIAAMSIPQSREIQSRIEEHASAEPLIQEWLDAGGYVKNLETIQGDEYDVMLLSFGYGRDEAGNIQLNFGPLSRSDGYRRLNVAVTRARRKMLLVTSLRASDIPLANLGEGGQFVRRYIDYAERGPVALLEDLKGGGIHQYESPFEEEVARQLRSRDWTVETQVGVSRYRIDLAVRDPDNPGRYLCGIECDGATYHDAETARDRDILRQEVLERLGWVIYRIWSPDWFRDRNAVLANLHAFLQGLRAGKTPPAAESPSPATDPPQPPPKTFKPRDPRLPPRTVRYRPHTPSQPDSDPVRWIASLIDREGPLHEDELFQALRDDYGHERMGSTIKDRFESHLEAALSQGAVERKGEYVFAPRHKDPQSLVLKVNGNGPRKPFDWYSDEELLVAIRLACRVNGGVLASELAGAVAGLLGLNTTQRARESLDRLLARAVKEGWVHDDGGVLRARQPMPGSE